MFDANLARRASTINANRADDRMRGHVMLAIMSLAFVGLGIQFGQLWLWVPFCGVAGYSALRVWDYRRRRQSSTCSVEVAQRPPASQATASAARGSGFFRPRRKGRAV